MSDYIPASDTDFFAWLDQFVTYVDTNLAALHLVAGDLNPLVTARSALEDAMTLNDEAQANARGKREMKDSARLTAEQLARALTARIQTTPDITDDQRQGLGITVRSSSRTPVNAPTTKPVASVDTTQRLQHTIAFVDELTPTSRAKPDGVSGCEIWTKIDGPAPADPGELQYLATDTRSPYVTDFDGGNAGKIAYYMLRWVSTRGETGPWSQTVAATITA